MSSMLSLFSCHHHQSPATSPALLLVATSLSTSAVHPSSPFSLSSRSRCRPTAITLPPPLSLSSLCPLHIQPLSLHLDIIYCRRLLSLTSTVGLFLRRGRPSWSIPLPPPLSLLCCSSFASPMSFCGLSRRPQEPPWLQSSSPSTPHLRSSVPSLFSPSASAPSSLIDAFTAASPPPTKTSCRRRLPYSSSTDVVATSLFLHRCPASPPATQEDPCPPVPPPLLVSASVRCHYRGLESEMGIG